MIKRNIIQEIQLTPKELATEFCEMDDEQQSEFFNQIGWIVQTRWDEPFEFQMQNIIDSSKLNDFGKNILKIIRDYME
jgi:hypothetical protein